VAFVPAVVLGTEHSIFEVLGSIVERAAMPQGTGLKKGFIELCICVVGTTGAGHDGSGMCWDLRAGIQTIDKSGFSRNNKRSQD
jgi:hypothetical protein